MFSPLAVQSEGKRIVIDINKVTVAEVFGGGEVKFYMGAGAPNAYGSLNVILAQLQSILTMAGMGDVTVYRRLFTSLVLTIPEPEADEEDDGTNS